MAKNIALVLVPLLIIAPVVLFNVVRHRVVRSSDSEPRSLEAILGLLFLVSFVTSVLGHQKVGTNKLVFLPLVILLASVVIMTVYSMGGGRATVHLRQHQVLKGETRDVVVGLVIAGLVLVPSLLHLSQADVSFGPATLFNGDIANYSLVADNVLGSGFGDSRHILNADYGNFARNNSYTTATGLMNLLSAVTGLHSYQVLLPSMGVAIVFLYLSVVYLLRSLASSTKLGELAVGGYAVMNSLTVHSIGQFYISAVLCTGALSIVIGSIVRQERSTRLEADGRTFFTLVLGLSVAVYAYGHIGLILITMTPLAGIFGFLLISHEQKIHITRRRLFVKSRTYIYSSLVAALLSGPAALSAWNLLMAQGSAQVGYALKDLNPLGIFLFPSWLRPSWTSGDMSVTWDIVTWTVFLVAVLGLYIYLRRKMPILTNTLILSGVVLLSGTGLLVWGEGTYQTWKLWSLLVPIVIVLIGVYLESLRRLRETAGVLLLGLILGIGVSMPWAVWDDKIWNPSTNTVLTNALETSARMADSKGYELLNIKLDPFLETMMAGTVIQETAVAFSSDSYLGQPLVVPTSCTFTREQFVPEGVETIPLVSPYVLANFPAKCK